MAEIKKPPALKKPLVPFRSVFDSAKFYGIQIEEHELLVDDAAIEDVLARGIPAGSPPVLEDLVERKKAFIDYCKRNLAGMHLVVAPVREKAQENAPLIDAAEAVNSIHRSLLALGKAGSRSSTGEAEAGSASGGLIKTGTLPSDSTPL
ncbi:hypothetical protein OROGR_004394 [Orobanche gracilis]